MQVVSAPPPPRRPLGHIHHRWMWDDASEVDPRSARRVLFEPSTDGGSVTAGPFWWHQHAGNDHTCVLTTADDIMTRPRHVLTWRHGTNKHCCVFHYMEFCGKRSWTMKIPKDWRDDNTPCAAAMKELIRNPLWWNRKTIISSSVWHDLANVSLSVVASSLYNQRRNAQAYLWCETEQENATIGVRRRRDQVQRHLTACVDALQRQIDLACFMWRPRTCETLKNLQPGFDGLWCIRNEGC